MKPIIPFKIFVLTISMLIAATLSAFSASGYSPIYDQGWYGWSGEIGHDFETLFDHTAQFCYIENNNFTIELDTDDRGISYYSFNTFAIYIPPGAKKVKLNVTSDNKAEVGLAVRFKSPPKNNDYSSFSYADVNNWEGQGSISHPSELEGSDYFFRNCDGITAIFVEGSFSPLNDGGWLYIKVLGEKNRIGKVLCRQEVDSETYKNWYDSLDTSTTESPDVWDKGEPPGDVSSGTSDDGDTGSGDSGTGDSGSGDSDGSDDTCTEYPPGDINQNCEVDLGDAIKILQILSGQE